MNNLLKRLIQDHKNMTRVHTVLKQEMAAFGEVEQQPDILLLLNIMDYLRTYSDGFHHPLEDRIYSEMRLHIKNELLVEMLDEIELQHAWLHVLARRVEGHFEAIANGQITSLARLIGDYESYIKMAEEHIACENEYLLPAVELYLSPAVLQQITLAASKTSDPLAEGAHRAAFDRLYSEIVEGYDEVSCASGPSV